MARRLTLVLLVLLVFSQKAQAQEKIGLKAPPGFEVTQYAGDELAHDIFSMTIDSRGRVVVAGRGYVKVLHDDDGDGKADRASLFSDVPNSGAHGLVFDGNDLICTGDNSVMRLRDSEGDGKADGKPEIWTRLRHAEHGANGLVRGPDGGFYLVCGNDAGVGTQHASVAGSPVVNPQCGAVLRFSPDGKQSQIVAHGFRNPYDLAFNAEGNLLIVDADGERDRYLPWYSPTRLFDVATGMHHGWIQKGWRRSWNRPPSYFDNTPRLVEIGRGSPTGAVVYRHRQFPAHYRGGMMSCCWTLGRVYHFPIKRQGASYSSRQEIFLETTGQVGFAPVDLAVGPEGDLFVAIGGRRTRGSVFRVRYVGNEKQAPGEPATDPLTKVLTADQPLAAWSRARWLPVAKRLGKQAFVEAAEDNRLVTSARIRAVEILVDLFDGITVEQAARWTGDGEFISRLAWALSRSGQGEAGEKKLAAWTSYDDPRVARAAWEGLLWLARLSTASNRADWLVITRSSERRIRGAALLADARRGGEPLKKLKNATPGQRIARLRQLHLRGRLGGNELSEALSCLLAADKNDLKMEAVRLAQLALGDVSVAPMDPDVYAGYVPVKPQQVGEGLLRAVTGLFPSGLEELDRELARLLGMLQVDDAKLLQSLTGKWTSQSLPQSDIHYLIVASRLSGARDAETTEATAAALAGLHHKLRAAGMQASRNWPLRVGEIFRELCRRDEKLPAALARQERLSLAGQAMFARRMTGAARDAAARRLIAALQKADEEESRWTNDLVEVASQLPPDEVLPALRSQWHDFGLRDAICAVLVKNPQPEDRQRFIDALASTEADMVHDAGNALRKLGGRASPSEMAYAMRHLRRMSAEQRYIRARFALAALLRLWSGQDIRSEEQKDRPLAEVYRPWFVWLQKAHPRAAQELAGFTGASATAWKKRLDKIDFNIGDAKRGRVVFDRRSCLKCHGGNQRLGPDLAGAAGRFSRNDLFAAIVEPNREVSPLYQTTRLATSDGRVYHGLVVYESPEGTLLQTSADNTLRVAGTEIISMRKSNLSLMPGGLLDEASDQELADLYAYLKTLTGGKK